MAAKKSNISVLDDYFRLDSITSQSGIEEFLRFATNQEECRIKWLECCQENTKLKKLLDEARKENNNLDSKLTTARKLLDQEKQKAIRAVEEKTNIENQLQMVRDLLFADNRNHIHDDTKEKLQFLNGSNRLTNDFDRLSAIHELDSTGSILSDLSYSRSDDGLDADKYFTKKTGNFKKQRCSFGGEEPLPVKRRRSNRLKAKADAEECMVATSRVVLERDGSLSAQCEIETLPSMVITEATPLRCASMESVESGLSIENVTNYNKGTPNHVGVLPIGSNKIISMRNHSLVSKTVLRPEECDVCEKRIKFSNTVLKCQNCKAACHPLCKDNLPVPCIASGSTPISKKETGLIADYAPNTPPLIPALVVHCINEVEARGLNEQGIYRVNGSDKDIRLLKEKFLRGRGVPRLADYDIHIICGCLKSFLRFLKEPLVTCNLWWDFARAAQDKNPEDRRCKLYQAISELPTSNKHTLAYVILHLLRVAEARETNKMDVDQLSIVFSPTIVGYPSDNISEIYNQTTKGRLVMEQFLNVPADYWFRLLSAPRPGYVTPRTMDPPPSTQRTPSTRSIKQLFQTPH